MAPPESTTRSMPVTVRPPFPTATPVFCSTIPAPVVKVEFPTGVPELMLRKVRPAAPICVFSTRSAVPLTTDSVFTIVVLFCVAVTVPPPVAVNASLFPVASAMPPVKAMLAPVLLLRRMPVPVSVIGPEKFTVPPVRFCTSTECPAVLAMVAPMLIVPAPPFTTARLTVSPLTETPSTSVIVPFSTGLTPAGRFSAFSVNAAPAPRTTSLARSTESPVIGPELT